MEICVIVEGTHICPHCYLMAAGRVVLDANVSANSHNLTKLCLNVCLSTYMFTAEHTTVQMSHHEVTAYVSYHSNL